MTEEFRLPESKIPDPKDPVPQETLDLSYQIICRISLSAYFDINPKLPNWISWGMLHSTLLCWQRFYKEPLSLEDALEMLLSVGRLGDLLEAKK